MTPEERDAELRKVRASLDTVRMMVAAIDARVKRAVAGPHSENVLGLRGQVGKVADEVDTALGWATEIVALVAGDPHPGGRGRSFGGRDPRST